MQTNVLIREECILKNKNKLCPYKKLSVFYNSCLKTFGSHLVVITFLRQQWLRNPPPPIVTLCVPCLSCLTNMVVWCPKWNCVSILQPVGIDVITCRSYVEFILCFQEYIRKDAVVSFKTGQNNAVVCGERASLA